MEAIRKNIVCKKHIEKGYKVINQCTDCFEIYCTECENNDIQGYMCNTCFDKEATNE